MPRGYADSSALGSGNLRVARHLLSTDKSAVEDSTYEAIRGRILAAMTALGMDASPLSLAVGKGKDYLRDFIEGRKQTISADALIKIEALAVKSGAGPRSSEVQPKTAPAAVYVIRGTVEKLDSNSIPMDLDALVKGLFSSHFELSADFEGSQVATLSLIRRLLGASSEALPRAEEALARTVAGSTAQQNRSGRA